MSNVKDSVRDYEVLDGSVEPDNADEYYEALQRQINSGLIWQMQGSMGRAAMDAINAGLVLVGKEPARDYWGNTVPSRAMLKAGTKGTQEFVAEQKDAEYAAKMAAIE